MSPPGCALAAVRLDAEIITPESVPPTNARLEKILDIVALALRRACEAINLLKSVKIALHLVADQVDDFVFNTLLTVRRPRAPRRTGDSARYHLNLDVWTIGHGSNNVQCDRRRGDFASAVEVCHDPTARGVATYRQADIS
jgi:hypothetical protein